MTVLGDIWRACVPVPMKAISYGGMVAEVQQQVQQLKYLCKTWQTTEMTHDRFMITVLAAQREFQGIPANVWDHSVERGKELVRAYNDAMKEVLWVYDTIDRLQSLGYSETASPDVKMREWTIAKSEVQAPSPARD